jgi:hypothetical protein
MDDEDGGLFNIEVSSDESVNESEKVPRDFQSEEDFQRQRKEWKPKIEKGDASILLIVNLTVEMYLYLARFGKRSSSQLITQLSHKARPSSMPWRSRTSLEDMKRLGVLPRMC